MGTHKDKVMPTDIQAIESKLKHTAYELKCSKFLWELDKKILFPVGNTTAGYDEEDPIAGIIRKILSIVPFSTSQKITYYSYFIFISLPIIPILFFALMFAS